MTAKPPFERVVQQHGPTVLRVCRALLGRDESDDAWSDTFLSAMQHYPDLPETANLEAWLVTIAHRKAIDITRARARRPVPIDETVDLLVAETFDAVDYDGTSLPDPELVGALAALPDKQRQTVAYRYLADLRYQEIAAIVGGNTAAARRAAADGIANLRRNYHGPHTPGESDDQ